MIANAFKAINIIASTAGFWLFVNINGDEEIISEMMTLTRKLGGELERSTCIDEKSGMKWKKIIITYDLET